MGAISAGLSRKGAWGTMGDSGVVLLICYLLLTCGVYLAWPSRWNVIGHMGLAMAIVAFVIPIGVLHVHKGFPAEVLDRFIPIMVAGTAAYIIGILSAKFIANPAPAKLLRDFSAGVETDLVAHVERRVLIALAVGAACMLAAFVGMGFIPLFADDPLAAKFFRGSYKEAYDRVSIIYRISWVILPTLIGVGLYMSLRRTRSFRWKVLTALGVGLLFLTLSRASIAQGLLLLVVVWLIWKKRTLLAISSVIASYVAGALFYRTLAAFGVDVLGGAAESQSLVQEIGATVPDVVDTLTFLQRWMIAGEPISGGRTLWGGLVPGNFEWAPAVWSITLGNPSVDITQISSGGLRLPAPVWGYLNFQELGVVLVPFLAGLIVGCVAVMISKLVPLESFFGTLMLFVFADVVINDSLGVFYKITYLTVMQFALIVWIMRGARPRIKRYGGATSLVAGRSAT